MARYTSLYRSGITPIDYLRQCLSEMLQSCNYNVIYEGSDYICAREMPGGVSFSKLVTVEVIFGEADESTTEADNSLHMSLVVKNEELPLNQNNHCRQQFNLVNAVVSSRQDVQLIESAA
ncbi:MAG: hypothetical protein F6K30_03605 [Cyanothece sp. SIO2G6]|nr:hypothetical protein [Cyanothece sp. SIO2G6]